MRDKNELSQFFTPTWACEMVVEKYLADLGIGGVLLDPTCGDGRFLLACPDSADAVGVEIDPEAAEAARINSGKRVITGDFREVVLDFKPTLIVGNPPFKLGLFEEILSRCYQGIDYGRKAVFILPAAFMQTPSSVARMAERWSLAQQMVPRTLFQGLELPLALVEFTKSKNPTLTGFFLYREMSALAGLAKNYKWRFVGNRSTASLWVETAKAALTELGGRGSLQEVYDVVEGRRPTGTEFWREKLRQVLKKHFTWVERGVYSL